ncbi:hypothetical protein NX059_000777 [Plenodomus lindquistii]|nr:hypothetical protein NX059_000777 [Plenodomus lindquistii]
MTARGRAGPSARLLPAEKSFLGQSLSGQTLRLPSHVSILSAYNIASSRFVCIWHMKTIQRFASTTRTLARSAVTTITRRAVSTNITSQTTHQATMDTSSAMPTNAQEEKTLPKLTPSEFRQWNYMAERMNYFHNNFRNTWKILYGACEANKRPNGMSIRQFIQLGQQFCHHLTMHHTIEEQHYFPRLARKMPAFRKELELLTQHKQIHVGLDKLEAYLEECSDGERELRMNELKEILDGFGEVLWAHLDDEVEQLGAENMRKFWTLEEMKSMF